MSGQTAWLSRSDGEGWKISRLSADGQVEDVLTRTVSKGLSKVLYQPGKVFQAEATATGESLRQDGAPRVLDRKPLAADGGVQEKPAQWSWHQQSQRLEDWDRGYIPPHWEAARWTQTVKGTECEN